jgi:predicted dehydrogenase
MRNGRGSNPRDMDGVVTVMPDVLIVGYGSIGKRHARNLLAMGIKPLVLTHYPDGNDACFFSNLANIPREVEYGVIASPTVRHHADFEALCRHGCRKILIEKPVAIDVSWAESIKELATHYGVTAYCAYNLRFMKVFDRIREVVEQHKTDIRLVDIVSGQYLPEWRPYRDYRDSYSAHRDQGGGVDLDISHEIDYMSWIFGPPLKIELAIKDKISSLDIDSPDCFMGIYRYSAFFVRVQLDYIRKKERTLRIIGEHSNIIDVDFINCRMFIYDKVEPPEAYFDIDKSYEKELHAFLWNSDSEHLASLDEGIDVLNLLRAI